MVLMVFSAQAWPGLLQPSTSIVDRINSSDACCRLLVSEHLLPLTWLA
jgi:hypothetical protein